MKFKFLSGYVNYRQYGGKWISKKLNNGDFDYWLVIKIDNVEDYEEFEYKYIGEILAVSPSQISKEKLDSAISSCGFSDEQIEAGFSDEQTVDILSDYGIFAMLGSFSDNNFDRLASTLRKEAESREFLFGFYMDKAENMLGQTGWQLIRGQDIKEYLDTIKD